MFQSYTVVPVFVFAIILNFTYVFSNLCILPAPAPTAQIGIIKIDFLTCGDCINSPCYTESHGPCISNNDETLDAPSTYYCFLCNTMDNNKHIQFYSEDECKKGCTDNEMTCACNEQCYVCVKKNDDISSFKCNLPTQMANDVCRVVNYTWTSH